jgi:hypothetical protein
MDPMRRELFHDLRSWNYVDTEELAGMKLGVVADEDIFVVPFHSIPTPPRLLSASSIPAL